jgi:hypothetical protein
MNESEFWMRVFLAQMNDANAAVNAEGVKLPPDVYADWAVCEMRKRSLSNNTNINDMVDSLPTSLELLREDGTDY